MEGKLHKIILRSGIVSEGVIMALCAKSRLKPKLNSEIFQPGSKYLQSGTNLDLKSPNVVPNNEDEYSPFPLDNSFIKIYDM